MISAIDNYSGTTDLVAARRARLSASSVDRPPPDSLHDPKAVKAATEAPRAVVATSLADGGTLLAAQERREPRTVEDQKFQVSIRSGETIDSSSELTADEQARIAELEKRDDETEERSGSSFVKSSAQRFEEFLRVDDAQKSYRSHLQDQPESDDIKAGSQSGTALAQATVAYGQAASIAAENAEDEALFAADILFNTISSDQTQA